MLWGACVADVGLPYQPFGDAPEATRAALARRSSTSLGPLAADLATARARVDRARRRRSRPPPTSNARARLFRAVQAALDVVATEPVVIVLDDLQFADEDALDAAASPHARTRRAALPPGDHRPRSRQVAAAAALADIHRRLPTTTLDLDGLTVDDLVEVLDATGVKLADDVHSVATQLAARTTGNPFYVTQLVLDAQTTRRPFDAAAVPDAVAQLVARRLDALDARPQRRRSRSPQSPATSSTLATLESCSVDRARPPPRHRRSALRANASSSSAARSDSPSCTSSCATPCSRRSPTTRRARLHRRLATRSPRAAPTRPCSRTTISPPARARRATRRGSSARGRSRGAWPRPRGRWRATNSRPRPISRPTSTTSAARSSASDARSARSGTRSKAESPSRPRSRSRAAHRRGARRRAGDARARRRRRPGRRGRSRRCRSSRAPPRRARRPRTATTTSTCSSPCWASSRSRSCSPTRKTNATRSHSAACAKRGGANNADGLAVALQARRIALDGSGRHGCARRRRTRDAGAPAARGRARSAGSPRELGLVEDLLELGDRAGVDAAIEARARARRRARASRTGRGRRRAGARSSPIIDGRLDEAETLAFEALAHQAPAEHPEAVAALGVNLVDIRLFQGRAGEMVDLLRDGGRREPAHPHLPRGARAVLCSNVGRRSTARAPPTSCSRRATSSSPPTRTGCSRSRCWPTPRRRSAIATGARALLRLLEPYADRHVVLNCFGGGGAYWGPVAHHLGRLEATARAGAEHARALLERAIDASRGDGRGRVRRRSAGTLTALVDR